MSEQQKPSEEKESKLGFIGYFDLLGYRRINPTGEMISVIKIVRRIVEDEIKRKTDHEGLVGEIFCECVAFADSILVYTTFPKNEHNQHVQINILVLTRMAIAGQPALTTNSPTVAGEGNPTLPSFVHQEEPIETIKVRAEKGDAAAQLELSKRYRNGTGVSKNHSEEVKWLSKSAENGSLEGSRLLGIDYLLETNFTEGMKWIHFAADRGDADSQIMWGGLFQGGGVVEKNLAEAAKWYKRAAMQGDGDAQILLGWMYAEGTGVMQNFVEAYKWFNVASASSENFYGSLRPEVREAVRKGLPGLDGRAVGERAKEARDWVASQMTGVQIAEAQRLSAAFSPRKESQSDRNGIQSFGNELRDAQPRASGTGFFITVDGFLVTNDHVVKDAIQVRLVTAAGLISAKVVKVDAANDLALLKAEGRFAPLPISSSRTVKLGGTVATVGFPNTGMQGFAPKLAKGEIASLSGAADDARYFQISVPVQPGNSGGALVDARGNVVGIVAAKLNASAALDATGALPENVNYAVKSSFLLSFLESVPDVASKLKEPNVKEEKFEDVVKSAQDAAVLVLVY